MSSWLLFPVSVGVLYVGGQILRLIFSLIDQAHDRSR